MQPSTSWRQILKSHSGSFLTWLDKTNRKYEMLDCLARKLSDFLIARIRSEADAREFWNTIPCIRAACNDLSTYELPWAGEAYAYVHLLLRYHRTWAVLKHLTAEAVLPLGRHGVRVLDVGTGPAPVLYAIDDFYSSLYRFAQDSGIQELCIPPPELDCIENSPNMARFMHHFSEYCGRRGPFGPSLDNFEDLDFPAERKSYFKNNRYKTYWDNSTEEYEDWDDSYLVEEESNSLFRFRLVVFSNFLTLGCTVSHFEKELRTLFDDLRPGSVVIILGATGGDYQEIFERLGQMARDANMRHDDWDTDALGSQIDKRVATRIKTAQHDVYCHLERVASTPPLPKNNSWPDYWCPEPSSKLRTKFALRVFRLGKWPTTGSIHVTP